jgi:phage baseplate assembly protein W
VAAPTLAERYSAQRKNEDLYTDFFTNLNSHPDSKQLVINRNESAVIRSVRNLILTNKYERRFQPTIGSRLQSFLFEPASHTVAKGIEEEIRYTIETFEPRANLIDIKTSLIEERNTYVVSVTFALQDTSKPTTFSVVLNRVR